MEPALDEAFKARTGADGWLQYEAEDPVSPMQGFQEAAGDCVSGVDLVVL